MLRVVPVSHVQGQAARRATEAPPISGTNSSGTLLRAPYEMFGTDLRDAPELAYEMSGTNLLAPVGTSVRSLSALHLSVSSKSFFPPGKCTARPR
eukprot:2506581-Rhodomonas_salina.2